MKRAMYQNENRLFVAGLSVDIKKGDKENQNDIK
jgi:hypothetical protein